MNKLIVICGLSFAGKSTLGKAITERFGYEIVDVDDTKVLLYGSDSKDEELKPEQWIKIYSDTDKQIETYLQSGKTVVDASRNFKKVERDKIKSIVEKLGFEVITIYIDTPESVARERLTVNRKNKSRRDTADKDFEEIIQVIEPPNSDEKHLVFHYEEDINIWISKNSVDLG